MKFLGLYFGIQDKIKLQRENEFLRQELQRNMLLAEEAIEERENSSKLMNKKFDSSTRKKYDETIKDALKM